jgi:GT2 family glycosyltransferase
MRGGAFLFSTPVINSSGGDHCEFSNRYIAIHYKYSFSDQRSRRKRRRQQRTAREADSNPLWPSDCSSAPFDSASTTTEQRLIGTTPSTVQRNYKTVAAGKFLRVSGEDFLVRGVAYGTFAPRADGHQFPEADQVRRDFDLMRAGGINTVRTYLVPPPDVLDLAAETGLRVMAGVSWPQHVAFLDDRSLRRGIIRGIGEQVRSIANHPAVLLTAIGNEIPAGVVRWHGRRNVEAFLRAAFDEARDAAPEMLLTYVNFPPTEFLELPFLDVHAFNVYLHDETAMRAYVARLHHIAGNGPLLLTECGADSQRETEEGQARLAAMQTRVAFSEGACGAIVFSWTDDWWRAGASIDDWSFGLVDRDRQPKPAYAAVSEVFATAPLRPDEERQLPSVSVVVCAYNAADTIDDCLTALERVKYPRFEIIVVDDGSTDETASRARRYPRARLIQTANSGLGTARNVGLHAASGEIVAYVDADVRVDPLWLIHLVQPFVTSTAVAAGGPNVAPSDDGWFSQCVARAPGAPSHVMFDDRRAEHIPGCNFAARRDALLAIRGFDPIFLRAGDDVDVCWRLQDRGGWIAFAPAALVWHHHRARLTAYWRQQVGYGEGEAWLRFRHGHRFSRAGVAWRGRIYSGLPFVRSLTESRLHSGVWGTAAFPTVYHMRAHAMRALPHRPEWLIASVLLLLFGVLPFASAGGWIISALAITLGLSGIALTLVKCAVYGWRSDINGLPELPPFRGEISRCVYRATIAGLHVVQPFARSYGFARGLLRPPRSSRDAFPTVPAHVSTALPRTRHGHLALLVGAGECQFWSETWTGVEALLTRVVDRLRTARLGRGVHVDDGWRSDRDISIGLGVWGWAHMRALVEDHGSGRCLVRARLQLRLRLGTVLLLALTAVLVALTAMRGHDALAGTFAAGELLLLLKIASDVSRGAGDVFDAVASAADEFGMQQIVDPIPHPRALPERDLVTAVIEGTHGLNRHTVGD